MDDVLTMIDAVRGSATKVKVAGVKFPRPQNAYAFLLAGADLIGTRDAPGIIEALDQMRQIGLVPAYDGCDPTRREPRPAPDGSSVWTSPVRSRA